MSPDKKLNKWFATAICGNDITSSCLYVSALTIGMAGQYAWIALLMVAAVLFLFRKIYGEVAGALPRYAVACNILFMTAYHSSFPSLQLPYSMAGLHSVSKRKTG